MFGRIFGRGKDEPDQAVCASCGRTLLAGEWTQQVVDEGGEEKLICSLCAQSRPLTEGERAKGTTTPANAGRVRESRSDSDAFWRALKEKDLEIERLQALLARAEAEKQELLGRLARSRPEASAAAAESPPPPEAQAGSAEVIVADDVVIGAESWQAQAPVPPDEEAPELAAATWGETPDELAAALAEFEHMAEPQAEAAPVAETPEAPADDASTSVVSEDTQPISMEDVLGDETPEAEAGTPVEVAESAPAAPAEAPIAAVLAGEETAEEAAQREAEEEEAAEREAEAAASLTLLQRGVDLLNVSTVPRKIAETNEHLGLPSVHVGFDGQTVGVTFLWTMGWYRFSVDIESGGVRMDERGYDERRDLQPNAGVRADGTVHLAPAQISRAAAAKQAAQEQEEAPPAEEQPAETEPPSFVAQKAPEFVSKSLLGQRSDDEPWDGTKARDFNWDR